MASLEMEETRIANESYFNLRQKRRLWGTHASLCRTVNLSIIVDDKYE